MEVRKAVLKAQPKIIVSNFDISSGNQANEEKVVVTTPKNATLPVVESSP